MANKRYSKREYADIKGVSPSRITALLKKLKMDGNKIVDCKVNDNLFSKKAHNRGGKRVL